MKVLITGAGGYIGHHLCDFLSSTPGISIRKFPSINFLADGCTLAQLDKLRNLIEVQVSDIDAVIHLYGTSAGLANNYNNPCCSPDFIFTKMLLESKGLGRCSTFIYMSSIWIYGTSLKSSYIDEATAFGSRSNYGNIKEAVEALILSFEKSGLKKIIFRASNIFGYDERPYSSCWGYSINQFCRDGVKEGFIKLNTSGSQHRDNVSIANVTQAIAFAMNNSKLMESGVYNLTSGYSKSVLDSAKFVANRVNEILGYMPKILIGEIEQDSCGNICISNKKMSNCGFIFDNDEVQVIDNLISRLAGH